MFFHLRVFLHSMLFFLILKLILTEAISGFLIGLIFENSLLLSFLILVFISIISLSALRIGRKWIMLPVPVLLAVSSVGLVAFIDSSSQKFVFTLLATGIYYFCLLGLHRLNQYGKDKTARGIISSCAAASIFFFYSSVYGAYMNFTISLWMIMLAFFVASSLVSLQYFRLVEKDRKKTLIYAIAMGISMTEIAWVLNFWPFGYLTTGVIMLIFYYVLWDLVCSYFMRNLSKKRVMANMIFFGILTATVLVSSKWLPVI